MNWISEGGIAIHQPPLHPGCFLLSNQAQSFWNKIVKDLSDQENDSFFLTPNF